MSDQDAVKVSWYAQADEMALTDVFLKVLEYGQYLALAALVAAVIASGLRSWSIAAIISRAIIVVSVGMILLVVGFTQLELANADVDPSQKARMIAEGISMMLNCGALFGLTAMAGFLILSLARRRLQAIRRA